MLKKNTYIGDKNKLGSNRDACISKMFYDIISSTKLKKSSIKTFVTESDYIFHLNNIAISLS